MVLKLGVKVGVSVEIIVTGRVDDSLKPRIDVGPSHSAVSVTSDVKGPQCSVGRAKVASSVAGSPGVGAGSAPPLSEVLVLLSTDWTRALRGSRSVEAASGQQPVLNLDSKHKQALEICAVGRFTRIVSRARPRGGFAPKNKGQNEWASSGKRIKPRSSLSSLHTREEVGVTSGGRAPNTAVCAKGLIVGPSLGRFR